MTNIKTTETLTKLLEEAKALSTTPNNFVSVQRFLLVLIEKTIRADVLTSEKELFGTCILVKKSLKDLGQARELLCQQMAQEETASSRVYMRRKLRQAAQTVESLQRDEVDAITLFLCIRKEPFREVLPIFEPQDLTDEVGSGATFADVFAPWSQEDKQDPLFAGKSPRESISTLVEETKRIRGELKDAVYGQDNAIDVFTTGYFQANLRTILENNRNQPRATFLFAGPPGVGKTFLAEKAAESLKLPFRRFDMSEYADKEANLEFCGTDKVYKNGKAGNVTSFVADNPRCVILFDEIEKAHLCVIHLFLQMLDAGRLRDNYTDKEISFSDVVIIMTTNAGKQLYLDSADGNLSTVSRKVVINALQTDINPTTGAPFFPGAICSRFASGNVVMFNHIGVHDLRGIAKKEIQRHATALEKETGIKLQVLERVYTTLLFAEGSAADARTVRARADAFINAELYELMRLLPSKKLQTLEKIRVIVDLRKAKPEIAALYAPEEKTKVLVLGAPETVALCQGKDPSFQVFGAQTQQEALELMRNQEVSLVLLDMKYGVEETALPVLNAEDEASPARELLKALKDQRNQIPMYLLEIRKSPFTEEEKISFQRQGVRGVLRMKKNVANDIGDIISGLHQQASMKKLEKEKKVITFETAQSISKDGKIAQIKLFDFRMDVAVDSEDSKKILSAVSKPNVRFADVIGAEDAKKELSYFVEYLKNPRKYMGTGVKAPRGVILYGPPGTGKTMLAKAMASESGLTFIAAEGNQFLKGVVGAGGEKVHEVFRTARKYAPSILFVDEIDAIAKERRGGSNSGNAEETLTAFLTEMDGFSSDPTRPVFVLAATNFDVEPGSPKSLDPALMRRFDRRVYIDLPNREERIRFLKLKRDGNPALQISDEQVDNIALRATGMSLAELDSAVELALRSAIRQGSTVVNDAILEEAFETFNGGEVKVWDESQLQRVARHEAGHALLCWLAGETPTYLTIVARGGRGGYMQRAEQEGKGLFTKEDLLGRIRTALGGRAAELVYYGNQDGISTGAAADLVNATEVARRMICAYGMDEDFGLAVAVGEMSAEVRKAVNAILKEQLSQAVRLISEHRAQIDALVEALMAKNHLNAAEIRRAITQNAGV